MFCAPIVLTHVTNDWIEPWHQKHRHAMHRAPTIFSSHVDTSQCEAVFRKHCFAERFGPQVCNLFIPMTLLTRNILNLISSYIRKYATSMCFNLPIPVFGGLCINGQHWLHLITQILQQRHNSFRLRRSQCAAYSSATALLAMIFCWRVYAFKA